MRYEYRKSTRRRRSKIKRLDGVVDAVARPASAAGWREEMTRMEDDLAVSRGETRNTIREEASRGRRQRPTSNQESIFLRVRLLHPRPSPHPIPFLLAHRDSHEGNVQQKGDEKSAERWHKLITRAHAERACIPSTQPQLHHRKMGPSMLTTDNGQWSIAPCSSAPVTRATRNAVWHGQSSTSHCSFAFPALQLDIALVYARLLHRVPV